MLKITVYIVRYDSLLIIYIYIYIYIYVVDGVVVIGIMSIIYRIYTTGSV
jgi:hypothetical protein